MTGRRPEPTMNLLPAPRFVLHRSMLTILTITEGSVHRGSVLRPASFLPFDEAAPTTPCVPMGLTLSMGYATGFSSGLSTPAPLARRGRQPQIAAASRCVNGFVSPDFVAHEVSLQARLRAEAYQSAVADAEAQYAKLLSAKDEEISRLKEEVRALAESVELEAAAKRDAIAAKDAAAEEIASAVKDAKKAAQKAYAKQRLEESAAVSQREIDRHVTAALASNEQQCDDRVRKARDDAAAAHRSATELLKQTEQMPQILEAATEALVREVQSQKMSAAKFRKQAEHLREAERVRREREGSAHTVRQRAAALANELTAARANDAELRTEIERLHAVDSTTSGLRDRPAAAESESSPQTVTLIAPRTSDSSEAPLTARTCEYLRRICEETGGSFHGAATAIGLVLDLFIEGGATEAQLISNVTIKHAFDRLGMLDDDCERAINASSKQYWAIGSDGGNKGRAIEMIAYCVWDAVRGKPVARPLSASDLFSNQTAANGERTALLAVEHLGLKPEFCSTYTTDGTDHALQQAANSLVSLHKLSCCQRQQSAVSNCCIHGKALEENAGLEAAWPGDRVVGALRMLWEIVGCGEGGRRDEYRESWVVDCKFPAALFDSTLGSMPEPTSAKWQVCIARTHHGPSACLLVACCMSLGEGGLASLPGHPAIV